MHWATYKVGGDMGCSITMPVLGVAMMAAGLLRQQWKLCDTAGVCAPPPSRRRPVSPSPFLQATVRRMGVFRMDMNESMCEPVYRAITTHW